jgi:hypothetical protein
MNTQPGHTLPTVLAVAALLCAVPAFGQSAPSPNYNRTLDTVSTVTTVGTVSTITGGTITSITNPVNVNASNGHFVTIDYAHEELHEGEMRSALVSEADQDSAEELVLLLMIPNGTEAHMIPSASCTGAFNLAIYENPTLTGIGTAVALLNRKRSIVTLAETRVWTDSTDSGNGTTLDGPWYYGATNNRRTSPSGS